MLINCNNKGCMESTDAKFDNETKEVVCEACSKPIQNVSESMKRVLKSAGQVVRTELRKAFTLACKSCNANREVVLDSEGHTVCGVCLSGITVHPSMRLAMEETGTKLRKISETKPTKPKGKTKKKVQ